MTFDTAALRTQLEESGDLHRDAMTAARATRPELAQIGEERKGEVDTDEIAGFNARRRMLLGGAGAVAVESLIGAGLAGLLASPARADTALDIQILQTASGLEALVVATYGLALGTGPNKQDAPAYKAIAAMANKTARDTVIAFATETARQHAEHRKAFQAQTTALDGNAKVQEAPNTKFLALVNSADFSTVEKVLDLAALLEKAATDTYLLDLSLLQDGRTKALMAAVMGVEAQHVAALRTFGALLKATGPNLVEVPFPTANLSRLPKAAGSLAFPDALETVNGPDRIAEPTSGAVK